MYSDKSLKYLGIFGVVLLWFSIGFVVLIQIFRDYYAGDTTLNALDVALVALAIATIISALSNDKLRLAAYVMWLIILIIGFFGFLIFAGLGNADLVSKSLGVFFVGAFSTQLLSWTISKNNGG